MLKKNAGLLIVALIVVVAIFAIMFTSTTYAGTFAGALDSQFVAHCAGTVGGTCSVGFAG